MRQQILRGLRTLTYTLGASAPRRNPLAHNNHQHVVRGRASPANGSSRRYATQTAPAQAPPAQAQQPLQLRSYQLECIQAVVTALQNGHKRVGISLATGGGKTVIFTQLIQHIQPPREGATQTLILAHRRELVEQAARHCTNTYPDKTVEIDMANSKASGVADITVASVASLQRDRLDKYNPNRFKLVLVDEAHHIVAPGYIKVLKHFGLMEKSPDSPNLVGVSATFSRFDGMKLGAAIDEIVYHKDYVDMIDEKWLSGVLFTTVRSTADLSGVRKMAGDGDFITSDLSRAVNTDQVNDITVRSWLAKASERKSTLVFCVDLNHVAGLTAKFRQHGLDARFVTGDTHKLERGEILDAFKRGEFPVLLNCGVFTEGTDIPNIDCVILARPTRSRNLLVQMIGRGMRLHKGKEDCHIIDMVSTLETGIVTVPTLFGLDPAELVSEVTLDGLKTIKERKEAEASRQKVAYSSPEDQPSDEASSAPAYIPQKITFTEYDSVFDLISDTSGERHINAISQYAWVQINPNKYILGSDDGSYLRLEKDAAKDAARSIKNAIFWRVFHVMRIHFSKSPYATPRQVIKAVTFSDAVHGADKYAQSRFPDYIISRNQKWRTAPPTENQLKLLNKMRPKDDQLTADDITKGKAMDMINKIKHGAKGYFAQLVVKQKRHHKEVNQEMARKARETVKVGPLEA